MDYQAYMKYLEGQQHKNELQRKTALDNLLYPKAPDGDQDQLIEEYMKTQTLTVKELEPTQSQLYTIQGGVTKKEILKEELNREESNQYNVLGVDKDVK